LQYFGELEAEETAMRVSAARSRLQQVGRWPGGGVPFGYRTAPNPAGAGRILERDPVKFTWLSQIVTMAQQGVSKSAIAAWLNDQFAPLPKRETGTLWSRNIVAGLLRNPIIAGMTPCNPGRGRSGPCDPFAVVRDEMGKPVVNSSLAVITVVQFRELQAGMPKKRVPSDAG
jgi:hypothetical protein